jgi:hypothetical protein
MFVGDLKSTHTNNKVGVLQSEGHVFPECEICSSSLDVD